MFGGARSAIFILIPVLAPVVGIACSNPNGKLAQPVAHEGREIPRVGGCAAIQRPANLIYLGVTIDGVTSNHSLGILRL